MADSRDVIVLAAWVCRGTSELSRVLPGPDIRRIALCSRVLPYSTLLYLLSVPVGTIPIQSSPVQSTY